MIDLVKQLLCIFLVLWLGAQANLAQAHSAHEAVHQLTPATEVMSDMAHDAVAHDAANHDEHCTGAHCHHGAAIAQSSHSTGYLAVGTPLRAVDAALISRLLSPEIERPKWALATHAVAGF
jgi:hypothetical protein